jgi:hypothetical protein
LWFSRETDLLLSLPAAVNQRAVVLDGGLTSELERRGHDVSSRLWSAGLLADYAHAIGAVHRAFLAAGAAPRRLPAIRPRPTVSPAADWMRR